ncbi:hypothetical protein R1flu_012049 [Riccia fluitans]|uniref:Uncharacterized protein n=1 Tax=Riccia fluitans TaxID=41844 RepID=A0ABD1ZDN1_9MARC
MQAETIDVKEAPNRVPRAGTRAVEREWEMMKTLPSETLASQHIGVKSDEVFKGSKLASSACNAIPEDHTLQTPSVNTVATTSREQRGPRVTHRGLIQTFFPSATSPLEGIAAARQIVCCKRGPESCVSGVTAGRSGSLDLIQHPNPFGAEEEIRGVCCHSREGRVLTLARLSASRHSKLQEVIETCGELSKFNPYPPSAS